MPNHVVLQLVSTVERRGNNVVATITLPAEAAQADSTPQLQWYVAYGANASSICQLHRLTLKPILAYH